MLKPQNVVQAAEMDLKRINRNRSEAEFRDPHYEHYAFHRRHVHMAKSARELMVFALMEPHVVKPTTNKGNMKMIYGDAQLLIAAINLASASSPAGASAPHDPPGSAPATPGTAGSS